MLATKTSVVYEIVEGPAREILAVDGPLYCPYYNRWGKNIYWQSEAFEHDPFHVAARSTSGSPVIMDGASVFCGFLKDREENGCRFIHDGQGRLEIRVPEGQRLFVSTSALPDEAWKTYNSLVLADRAGSDRITIEPDWILPEYCTWVEQKRYGLQSGKKPSEILDEDFVYEFMDRLDRLDYPRGKLTIDDGWTPSPAHFGDWTPDPVRFPAMERLFGKIASTGHVPGLWLAPVWVHERSLVAQAHPEWVGDQALTGQGEPNNLKPLDANEERHYWKPVPELESYFRKIFGRYIDIGVRKFKLDMAYGDKALMKRLHALMYRAVKSIDPAVEMEIHHPDIFFARYGDSVRTNDVLCNESSDWKDLTKAHFAVCRKSAPGKVINLDHIGGNDPEVREENFIEHLRLYEKAVGYPVVSLLPDGHGGECRSALHRYLHDYVKSPNAVSDFVHPEVVESSRPSEGVV